MKCEHCGSENLFKRFIRTAKRHNNKFDRFFRCCKDCNYNSYYNFPKYLDESQYARYVEQATRKANKTKLLEL
jgi:hypothetical protein